MEKYNKETGLSEVQEKAATLLSNGSSLIDVSKELSIEISVLKKWSKKITFKAEMNRLSLAIKESTEYNLLSLYGEALDVLRSSLKSENEPIKLKTAMYLIKKIESKNIGVLDARVALKEQSTSLISWNMDTSFDAEKYNQLCKENNLQID